MNSIYQAVKGEERKNRIEQGFFDGRFRPKQVPNKKKAAEKKLCRSKVIY